MKIDFPVFTSANALQRRGSKASEMIPCPRCKKESGVFVNTKNRMDFVGGSNSRMFHEIVWEHWNCINCHLHWTEKYGVSKPPKPAKGCQTFEQLRGAIHNAYSK